MAPDDVGHDSGAAPLAVVTGASSGIGLELAREFGRNGYDLLVVAEEEPIGAAATELRAVAPSVESVRADLATADGVESLLTAIAGRPEPPAAVVINAGIGVNGTFWETDLADHLDLIALNVTGAVHLAHEVLPSMVAAGTGGLLITSSIAATMPGPYLSTYSASKAFLKSFAEALRNELADTGVTVTALMPGPTETDFFDRADMTDTKLGQAKKDDPADVAHDGYEAFVAGKDHVVAGSVVNRLQTAGATALPDRVVAAAHARMSEPGSGSDSDSPDPDQRGEAS